MRDPKERLRDIIEAIEAIDRYPDARVQKPAIEQLLNRPEELSDSE
ncbi:MAG: hypothetical protein HPY54_06695 [Chthonomonadetes bacterium]|nr:hypothetical protein [Chthonomonadetes bacterium]